MSVVIPDQVLSASGLSAEQFLQEIVLMLFQQKRISIGTASNLLEMNLIQFQHLIDTRNIYVHYDVDDLRDDVMTLQSLGRL
jgi:predicted HTH domain antitoxin